MFLEYFGMKEQPFGVTPDPRFLYLGKSHREALASLYYGVESDRGFVTLIAPPGLGKTTLTFQLLEKLQETYRTVFLFQTKCNSKEFLHYLLNGLGVDAEGMELVSMHNKLNEILAREMLAGSRLILAIDEAQNLDPEVLETIRLLSNFETSRDKLLQILLIGQPQLANKLARPELEQLQQRISIFARLEPFDYEDTARYITHRVEVAGYEGSPLFSPAAIRIIAEQSQGIPRKINGLCFSALSIACAMGRKQVDVGMMEEVILDRNVESLERPRADRSVTPPPVVPRPAFSSPMLSRPTLSSYPAAEPKKSFGRWAGGTTIVATAAVIGFTVLTFAPGRFDRSLKASFEAWTSFRNVATSIRGFLSTKSEPVPLSSNLNVPATELPMAAQSFPLSEDSGTVTVIVQPGETLRRIILRTVGEYNGDTIGQVCNLNPSIANFDHIIAGQMIRLPRVSVPINSTVASDGADPAGKD